MRYFASLIFATAVSAQMDMKALIGDLSTQCQTASGSLMTSDFGTCANIMGLVNVIASTGSLLTPLNTWVDSICSAAACSPSTLSSASQSVMTGCEADVKKGVISAVELTALVSNYGTIRNALCLEYKSNHTRCASSFLASAEKSAGHSLNLTEVSGFLIHGFSSLAPVLSKISKETFCNDCGHALSTVLSSHSSMAAMPNMPNMPNMPSNTTASSASNALVGACGASFGDGKIPDTINVANGTSIQGTGNSNNPTNNPAAGGAPNSANSISIPVFPLVALLGATIAFTAFS